MISEVSAQVILRQFLDKKSERIVECVLLPDYQLWECVHGRSLFNHKFLILLLLLSTAHNPISEEVNYDHNYPEGDSTPNRSIRNHILSVYEWNMKEIK